MTHDRYEFHPICGHYSINPPVKVPCTPNPKDPSTCQVCTNPDPKFRGKEVVNAQDPSASCGKTTCRNAMDQRIHAGNFYTAAANFDANAARTATYNAPSQVRYAPMGNEFLRTTEGFKDQKEWAGSKAGGSSGGGSSSKKDKAKGKEKEKEKGKEKEKAKDKGKKDSSHKREEKRDSKGKKKEKK